MKEQEQKMKLPKLDDLFTSQEQRDYEKAEKVEEIDISNIKDFPNHPFKVNIAIILQYGHGTKNGGYVSGRDYINPALKPIFDKMADAAWKAVTEI